MIDFQTQEKTAQFKPEHGPSLSLCLSLPSSTMSSLRSAAPPRHQQTPAGNCRTRLLLPPSSAHITSLLEKKVIDTVSKATNHRAPRRGRVPDCNVYVRARPMGAQWRGRGILLEERGKTIFYPPNRAAFRIAGAAAAASWDSSRRIRKEVKKKKKKHTFCRLATILINVSIFSKLH